MAPFNFILPGLLNEHSDLPTIKFKDNSSLSIIVHELAGAGDNRASSQSDKDYINASIEALDEQFTDRLVHGESITAINNIVGELANTVKNSMADISNVKQTVASLASKIKEEQLTYLAKDPYYVEAKGVPESITPSFNEFDWSPLSKFGTANAIIAQVHDSIKIQNPGVTTQQYIDGYSRTISPSASKNSAKLNDVELPKEQLEELITTINDKVTDVLPDEIRNTVKLITNKKRAIQFINTTIKTVGDRKEPIDSLTYAIKHLNTTRMITNSIRLNLPELAESTKTAIYNNINYFEDVYLLLAYTSVHMRNKVFEQAVVLPNELLNPDTLPTFTGKGGTLMNIAHHLTIFFKDKRLPFTGITSNSIMTSMDQVSSKVESRLESMKLGIRRSENKAINYAGTLTLEKYIKDLKGTTFTHPQPTKLAQAVLSNITTKSLPIEEGLYDFVINLLYKGSFVETLYKAFGNGYLKLAGEATEISRDDIDRVDMVVLTDILSEFIFDNFVELDE